MKYNFNDSQEFSRLEDMAIDGQLDYFDFPPQEYKYFSRLAQLGYNNRHKGWNIQTCETLNEQYKTDYTAEKEKADEYLNHCKRLSDNVLRSTMLVAQMYKTAETKDQMLDLALQVIELTTNENGFYKRIKERLGKIECTH